MLVKRKVVNGSIMYNFKTGDTIRKQKATVKHVKRNATKTKIVAPLNAEPPTVPGGK